MSSRVEECGAMVVVTPAGLVGQHIGISRSEPGSDRAWVAVHRRVRRNCPPRYTAEFASLPPGDYTVWCQTSDEALVTVAIVAGKVTEVTLPGAAENSSAGM